MKKLIFLACFVLGFILGVFYISKQYQQGKLPCSSETNSQCEVYVPNQCFAK